MLFRRRTDQTGQAVVLVLLLTVVAVVATLMLLRTGTLTNEKMQLQNAADATAYSIATLEARDLNYGAYMNRAKVANEVAIGQMVSLKSWAEMKKGEADLLKGLSLQIKAYSIIPFIGQIFNVASQGVSKFADTYKKVYKATDKVVSKVAPAIGGVMAGLNQVYDLSQKAVHYLTFILTLDASQNIPKSNFKASKPEQSVGLSSFGNLSLMLHYASYYGDLLPSKTPLFKFLQYPTHDSSSGSGIERFVQVINDSRDSFSRKRGCKGSFASGRLNDLLNKYIVDPLRAIDGKKISFLTLSGSIGVLTPGEPPLQVMDAECDQPDNSQYGHGGWTVTPLGIDLSPRFSATDNKIWDKKVAGVSLGKYGYKISASLSTRFQFDSTLTRRGGVDVRNDATDQKQFTHSSFDIQRGRTDADFHVNTPSLSITICVVVCGTGSLSDIPGIGDFLTGLINDAFDAVLVKFPDIYNKASSRTGDYKKTVELTPRTTAIDDYRNTTYGGANSLSSKLRHPTNNNIIKNHKLGGGSFQMVNLAPAIAGRVDPRRTDKYFIGMEAPYILIALDRSQGKTGIKEPTGRFDLSDELPRTPDPSAISKAEVYYIEPDDLSYFNRFEGLSSSIRSSLNKEQYARKTLANGFNPYWHARLVDTSYIDRSLALAFQTKGFIRPTELQQLQTAVEGAINDVKRIVQKLGSII